MARPRFLNLQEVLDRQLFKGVCGIYILRCCVTRYTYIGSTNNLLARLRQHAQRYQSAVLRQSFEEYGLIGHEVALLEVFPSNFSESSLRWREAYWIWNSRARLNSQMPALDEEGVLKWFFDPDFKNPFLIQSDHVFRQKENAQSAPIAKQLSRFKVRRVKELVEIYQKLVEEHDSFLTHETTLLKQLIELKIQEIQDREQPLLSARIKQLEVIRRAIKMDVRYLLGTTGLQTFVRQLKEELLYPTENEDYLIQVDEDPLSWLVSELDSPIKISRFKVTQDSENSDEIYISFEVSLVIQIKKIKAPIQIQIGRLYFGDFARYVECGDREQHQEVLGQIIEPFRQLHISESQVNQFSQEVSCLVCFMGKLLVIDPAPFKFTF
jgi:hypothetical protein